MTFPEDPRLDVFFDTIRACPHDDTPRRAFADWLAGSCAKARRVQQLNYSATITDVQAASEPVLLRTALHYSRRTHGDLVRRCIGELTKRYLKAAQAYTARLAGVAA